MIFLPLAVPFLTFAIITNQAVAPGATSPAKSVAPRSADERFEVLLAAAKKSPKTTDWNALRSAFAETSHYKPYSNWAKEITKVGADFLAGKLEVAEAALVKLLERERYMRLDGHAMAVTIYEKMGQPEQARRHREFVEGLSSTIFVPGHGLSELKPIEVLFIDEEYDFLNALKLKVKKQRLIETDGHRFDVLTTEARGDEPERDYYFKIDLPQKALRKSMAKMFEIPDRKFETLLAAARKDPKKADWKALRTAFTETSVYKPYNTEWQKEIRGVAQDLAAGRLPETEAALVKILERERFMRIEAHFLAAALYEKIGQPEKASQHSAFFQGLTSVVFAPDRGRSFESPIEVLFPDEEFLVLGLARGNLKKADQVENNGHWYDVVTLESKGGQPERTFYFSIDLPRAAMQNALRKGLNQNTRLPSE